MSERFFVIHSTRRVLWVAALAAVVFIVFAKDGYLRVMAAGALVGVAATALLLRARRPLLTVDETGYVVTVRDREIVRVAWTEVIRVLLDPEDEAAYIDCGDRTRNLLLPPRYGSPFTYTNRQQLYRRLSTAVPDRTEQAPGLGRPKQP